MTKIAEPSSRPPKKSNGWLRTISKFSKLQIAAIFIAIIAAAITIGLVVGLQQQSKSAENAGRSESASSYSVINTATLNPPIPTTSTHVTISTSSMMISGSLTTASRSSTPSSSATASSPPATTTCPAGKQLVAGKYLVNNSLTTKEKLQALTSSISFTTTGNFDQDVLLAHNTYRSLLGKPPMTISAEAKAFAQNYSSYLAANNLWLHSTSSFGENLYKSSNQRPIFSSIQAWWNEYPIYNGELIPDGNFMGYGHYTQMIWDTSVSVGCGQAQAPNNGWWYTCCNYDPPGNYRGRSVSVVINGVVC